MYRAGGNASGCVCARDTLRVSKQFRSSDFELYLSVTELRMLDAPGILNGRRQEASTLQTLKSVGANRNPFPERTKPTITTMHSRSQEAQVYADFRQPLSAIRQHIILATDSRTLRTRCTRLRSLQEIAQLRTQNGQPRMSSCPTHTLDNQSCHSLPRRRKRLRHKRSTDQLHSV
jgi:hypothetical protein